MLPFIAIPVAHYAGGYIAYSGTGYLAGTLSTTWAGAFIAGNATALGATAASALGIVGITASTPLVGGAAVALGLTSPAWVMPAAIAAGVTTAASAAYGGYRYFRKDGSELMTFESQYAMHADAIEAYDSL